MLIITFSPFSGFKISEWEHFQYNLTESILLQELLCKLLNFHYLPVPVHSVPPPFLAILEIVTDWISTKLSSGG